MKNTIVIKLQGGLGNQLFQYALGRSIQLSRNIPVEFDISWYSRKTDEIKRTYELDNFQTQVSPADVATVQYFEQYQRRPGPIGFLKTFFTVDAAKYIQDFGYVFNQKILGLVQPAYLDGYWQSEKYFASIAGALRNELALRKPATGKNAITLNAIQQSPSISLHVRRGDYVASKQANAFHGTTTVDYYQSAISALQKVAPNGIIYVFSDDQAWVKANLRFAQQTIFVDWNTAEQAHEDLRLMAACQHNVIANSTFSWWGAWLNSNPNKVVIAPKKWFANPTMNTKDLLPDTWIQM